MTEQPEDIKAEIVNPLEEWIIDPQDQILIDAIENVGRYWYEMPMEDHPDRPQYSRKLVVTNFFPAYLEPPQERLYVNVSQILTKKTDNSVSKEYIMPTWEIYEFNTEEIENENGVIMATVLTKNEAGEVVSQEQRPVKRSSINYVKFLTLNRKAYLADIFGKFMIQYVNKFSSEINNI